MYRRAAHHRGGVVAIRAIVFIKAGYLFGTNKIAPAPMSGQKIIQDRM
jgi:hypothetical protein